MASLKDRVASSVERLRSASPPFDHAVSTVRHYGAVNGNAQAGAVTYFGFLSFFPILALAFFAVGYLSQVYDLQEEIAETIEKVLPGIVGRDPGEIPLSTFEDYAGPVGLVGLLGLVYAGLGWLSGMRAALQAVFRLPRQERPNFVAGKARDLVTLVLFGLILLLSVSLTGALTWSSETILGWLSLDGSWVASALLRVLGYGLATTATTVLLVIMFRMLTQPHVAARALTQGALLAAVGFEVLKSVASSLIALTKDSEAFQVFGVALILLIWINYFSRLVMLGAAWAYTAPLSVALRSAESEPLFRADDRPLLEPAPAAAVREDPRQAPPPRVRLRRRRLGRAAAAGAAGAAAAVAVVLGRRIRR